MNATELELKRKELELKEKELAVKLTELVIKFPIKPNGYPHLNYHRSIVQDHFNVHLNMIRGQKPDKETKQE